MEHHKYDVLKIQNLTYMEKEGKRENDFWGSTLCAAFFFADFMV